MSEENAPQEEALKAEAIKLEIIRLTEELRELRREAKKQGDLQAFDTAMRRVADTRNSDRIEALAAKAEAKAKRAMDRASSLRAKLG